MMKLFAAHSNKPIVSLIWLLTVILFMSLPGASASGQETGGPKQEPNEQADASGAIAPPTVVAKIGDYTLTREELEQRVLREIYPNDYDSNGEETQSIDARPVLLNMLAEKAMMIEGREKGFLKSEQIRVSIKRFVDRRLINLLFQKHVQANEDKIAPTEDEIKQKMLADQDEIKQKMLADPNLTLPDPNTTREKAESAIRRVKQTRVLNQYYAEISRKSNVKMLKQNFPKVVEIHRRLMTKPKQPRKVNFIRNWQVRDELTQSEKDIVLVQFVGGKVTLYDWFNALSNIVPPRRPRNLNTVAGVEQLLDRALSGPLLVAEAKAQGFEKDEEFLKQVRDYEDRTALGQVRSAKMKETKEPTPKEILAYFNENKKAFETGKNLKIDQIWCKDLDEAKKIKAELDAGKDFEPVKKQYTPDDKSKPYNAYPGSEGMFWKELYAGEPNDVLGPLKGFHSQKVQWRIVKILEKNPGKPREYSENMDGQIKSKIMGERNKVLMDQYGKELLEKYTYEIYADKIKGIDPLNIP
ncbi:peptidyl-prolyl cis-trans isomerase [Planctomycetota bacterium]